MAININNEKVITSASAGFKVRGLRWWIIGLIFFATLINYLDRLTISVLAPVITKDLNLTNTEFGSIAAWFLLAYTISQALSGKLYDRIGIKRGFTVSITTWSLAAIAHSLARGLGSLSFFRFILGFGEAGNWPGAAKTVAEWFPVRERAFGMAIFNSGAAIGSILAPPLIVGLTAYFGHWQPTFIVTGVLGFLWLLLWWAVYEKPEHHPWLTDKERVLIKTDEETEERKSNKTKSVTGVTSFSSSSLHAVSTSPVRWRDLLRFKQVWAIILARFLTDPVWWLYITWLPKYLADVRGFSLMKIGLFVWVPYVAADAGSLLGGWASGYLIGKGWSVDRSRKAVIACAACLMPAGVVAAFVESPMLALALIGIVLFGFQVWINNVQTLPSDFFADKSVASVAGLGGTGAGLGAMFFIFTTGWIVDHFSYTPILVAGGLLAPIGTFVLFALAGRIERVGKTTTALVLSP